VTSERPPGLLTEDHREYLRAAESERQGEYSRQTRYRRREGIRRRLKNGLLDMVIIQQRLEKDEREKIFDELFDEGEGGSDGYAALTAMAAFTFEGARQREFPIEAVTKEAAEAAVARDVPEGWRVHAEPDIPVEIIEPAARAPPPASAAHKLNDGAEVSELDTEEQAMVLRYVDSEGLTTDEVDGDALLEWWMDSEENPLKWDSEELDDRCPDAELG